MTCWWSPVSLSTRRSPAPASTAVCEEGTQTLVKPFKEYAPGFVHADVKYLPQLPDQDQRTYLFAAIDRATRWAYVEILKDKSATATAAFFKRYD